MLPRRMQALMHKGGQLLRAQVPGERYKYWVGQHESVWSFQAALQPGPDAAFSFVVYGDMGEAEHKAAKSPGYVPYPTQSCSVSVCARHLSCLAAPFARLMRTCSIVRPTEPGMQPMKIPAMQNLSTCGKMSQLHSSK